MGLGLRLRLRIGLGLGVRIQLKHAPHLKELLKRFAPAVPILPRARRWACRIGMTHARTCQLERNTMQSSVHPMHADATAGGVRDPG